jgi:hypothetical protein
MIENDTKYLEFIMVATTGKTEIWHVISKSQGQVLAVIKWYGAWRQYCFFPASNALFNSTCLDDIKSFLDRLNAKHRAKNNETVF